MHACIPVVTARQLQCAENYRDYSTSKKLLTMSEKILILYYGRYERERPTRGWCYNLDIYGNSFYRLL